MTPEGQRTEGREPLDPFERAVAFAIREALRLARDRRAKMTAVERKA